MFPIILKSNLILSAPAHSDVDECLNWFSTVRHWALDRGEQDIAKEAEYAIRSIGSEYQTGMFVEDIRFKLRLAPAV